MNLGHPFLIYGLCKKIGIPLKDNEAWIHPIKAIVVKKNKVHDLTTKFNAYWDETQEHHVSMSQEMEELKANIVLHNQKIIK